MRIMLALGILMVAAVGMAGPPICDSGCVAKAEDDRPVLKKSDRLRVPSERETAQPARERLVQEEHNPDVEREGQRQFRRGDFWTQDEFYRRFQRPDGYFPPANR